MGIGIENPGIGIGIGIESPELDPTLLPACRNSASKWSGLGDISKLLISH